MGTWTGSKRGAGRCLERCQGAQKACPGQLSAADTSSPMLAHGLTKHSKDQWPSRGGNRPTKSLLFPGDQSPRGLVISFCISSQLHKGNLPRFLWCPTCSSMGGAVQACLWSVRACLFLMSSVAKRPPHQWRWPHWCSKFCKPKQLPATSS